ncbi:dynactin subunit [Ophiocordyceps camponoti-floridani]|uniref:Dynactin subunit n=1 Tax=Ophiocordyceps camponoti-floridani TaxID=2030778 RepID=A0A8H4Q4Z6_9HYPO|nr:dynactin subunit [Ophiocordyceps camponoti-floridani]
MALSSKYATLPDLDSAPDIYETPGLTDDNSTVPTTTDQAPSVDGFEDVDDDDRSILRSRLRIGEARSRFLPAHIDARQADFSDRVDGKRRAYRASTRRHHVLEDGTLELGSLSDDDDDDDDEESLERKIARLKREVIETKQDYARRKSASADQEHNELAEDDRLEALCKALDDMSTVEIGPGSTHETARLTPTTIDPSTVNGPTYTITYAPDYQQSHALAKAADFDRRLAAMEELLGISSSSAMDGSGGLDGLVRAVLPTLDSMEKQISTLSQASTANLDAISRRVRTLASEQDKLNDSRDKAKALRDELGKHAPASPTDEAEQEAKINALYGILPSIENLTPLLPPLLDRLRSLRIMHADAASVSQTLDSIEAQQADMVGELRQWKEGLDKMEAAIRNGETTVKDNTRVVEGWVKDLEERLGRSA